MNDPYMLKDEGAFLAAVENNGFQVGLIVGNVKDPWVNTYQIHWQAPTCWRGWNDGVYLATWLNGELNILPFTE